MNVLAFVRGCSEAPYHRQEDEEVASQRLKTRVTGHSHVNSNASTAAHERLERLNFEAALLIFMTTTIVVRLRCANTQNRRS